MPSSTQDRLYRMFVAIAGEPSRFPVSSEVPVEDTTAVPAATVGSVVEREFARMAVVTGVASAVARGRLTEAAQPELVVNSPANLLPIISAIPAAGGAIGGVWQQAQNGEGGVGQTLETIASTVFQSALGLVPLVSGLIGLFGGGGDPAPPPLVKYAMPSPIEFQGAAWGSGVMNVDYDQSGRPRAYGNESAANSTRGAAGSPAITVNVQAMDARSFLDRSNDIAAAVRDAMLNLNSINDVVNDL